MKHEIRIVQEGAGGITESFGVDFDAFEGMVDNISLEIIHMAMFRNDKRTVSKCLLDALDNLDPAEFGLEPKTANDYLVLGIALARSIDLVDAMQDGVADKAKQKVGSVSGMASLLEKIAQRSESSSPIETKGSLN